MAEGFSSDDTFLSDVHVATSGTPSEQVGPSVACTVCCRRLIIQPCQLQVFTQLANHSYVCITHPA